MLPGFDATPLRREFKKLMLRAFAVFSASEKSALRTLIGAASTTAATDTAAGIVELATTAEALAGTDATRAVTPAGLAVTRRLAQRQRTNVTSVVSGTATTIPVDTSIPQITEGAEMMTLSITPTVTGGTIVIHASACFGISAANDYITMALFRDAVANALDARTTYQPTVLSAPAVQLNNHYEITGATVGVAITFRVRAGSNGGATPYLNGSNTATPTFSGVSSSYILAEEYFP